MTQSTNHLPRTACDCGTTNFSVAEILWHRATIENGQLILIKADSDCGGFASVSCARCGKPYSLDEFDVDNLTNNL